MLFFYKLSGIAFGAFIMALSGALMPGPLLTVTVSETIKRGKWAGAFLIIGHAILELSLIVVILTGFDYIFKINKVVGVISLLGGLLLLWMGWDSIKKARELSLAKALDQIAESGCGPVLAGIIASISNPYWFIWWATIGFGYMAASLIHGWLGITMFFIGHISADFAWYTLVSFSIAGGKGLISDRVYHGILIACGGILCIFGVIFLYVGFRRMGL